MLSFFKPERNLNAIKGTLIRISDLKKLLIRTYKLEKSAEFIKLHFSVNDNELLMHDYDDHRKTLTLVRKIDTKKIRLGLTTNSHNLIKESLYHSKPAEFLNMGFKLNGFFRS